MKILVTGGAGFIASHIVDSLVRDGHEVVVYDNFSTGLMQNLEGVKDQVEIVQDDILNYESLKKAMEGCQYVSHHAAQLEIFLSISNPEDDLKQNTIGTLNVLRAAKENNVEKIINASSACVYGQTEDPSSESDDPCPNWAYGVSKLAAEKYASIYNDYEGVKVVSLRYGIVYGEREWYRRVLPIMLKRVIQGESPVVFGDGHQIRDFVYVGDVVEFNNMCLFSADADGHVFNVGSGVGTSIVDLAKAAVSLSDKEIEIVHENTEEGSFSKLIEGKKRNSAELKRMLLDMKKVETMFGWLPSTPLSQGLRNEYEWAAKNLSRWDKVVSTQW